MILCGCNKGEMVEKEKNVLEVLVYVLVFVDGGGIR